MLSIIFSWHLFNVYQGSEVKNISTSCARKSDQDFDGQDIFSRIILIFYYLFICGFEYWNFGNYMNSEGAVSAFDEENIFSSLPPSTPTSTAAATVGGIFVFYTMPKKWFVEVSVCARAYIPPLFLYIRVWFRLEWANWCSALTKEGSSSGDAQESLCRNYLEGKTEDTPWSGERTFHQFFFTLRLCFVKKVLSNSGMLS